MKTTLATSAALIAAQAAVAQPSVTPLPTFTPYALSADGRVLVGQDAGLAAYWTRQTGIVHLSTPMDNGAVSAYAVGVSGDGSVIVGQGQNSFPSTVVSWVWTPEGSTVLAVPGLGGTRATCVSQDGRTVGGIAVPENASYQSFVWTQADGYRMIPWGTNYATWIHALSADGLKGAGSGSSATGLWPTYWGSTYVWCQNFGPLQGQSSGVAYAISGDGSTIVGHLSGTSGPAFVWSARDGFRMLTSGSLETVSYDGHIAAGSLMWIRGAGVFSTQSFLAAHGVNANTGDIVAMSGNARVFAAHASLYGVGAVIVDLGACGSADFDHDGNAGTDADIEAFFNCLAGDCCPLCDSADFNYDGDAGTDADIEAFFRVLAGGNC